MKKFNFYENGTKCSITYIETGNKITGIRARIALLLGSQIGKTISFSNISATVYNKPFLDFYQTRSLDVHLLYVKKFFKECGYDFSRVRNVGVTVNCKENVV